MGLESTVGVKGTAAAQVGSANTAVTMGSGSLPVFATPALAALMEQAAVSALHGFLPLGTTSVGVSLSVNHSSATPVGHNVSAEATVLAVEGRRVRFKLVAYDEQGKIGDGTHERFVVEAEAFMAKLAAKRPKQ